MAIARYYAYTDASAPQITGEQGTLKELLKKILVGTAGVAYGSGASEKPSLGWSLEYEATAKAIFKGAVGSSGMLLRVDDSGSGTGSYREAFVYGCESATDVDTVTDRFPTSAQISGGAIWRKSNNLNSTAVPWWLFGDDRTFYLFINWYGSRWCGLVHAGDFTSIKPGDSYNFRVSGGNAENYPNSIPDTIPFNSVSATTAGAINISVAARSYNQVAKSVAVSGSFFYGSAAGMPAYPASIVSGLILSPITIHELNMPRGVLRGAFFPMHATGLSDLLAVTGVAGFPGATVYVSPSFGDSQTRIAIPVGVEW